jgi:FAD/FMN-containing dehydrogenase
MLTTPDGFPAVALLGCYCGDPAKGESVIRPIREFGQPLADLMQPMPYADLQKMLDGAAPYGHRYYWKSCFLKELSDKAIDKIISNAETVTSPLSAIFLEYYDSPSNIEPPGGTAYAYRQSEYDLVIISNWLNSDEDGKNISWTRNFYETMQPHSSHKVYMNALGVEGEQRVKEAYGENYQRLALLKKLYDPTNLFRLNQNITPAE